MLFEKNWKFTQIYPSIENAIRAFSIIGGGQITHPVKKCENMACI
jgi:hypothetical protein